MEVYLPTEIWYEIFLILRPAELRSCCCVCTRWNSVISEDELLDRRRNVLDVYGQVGENNTFPIRSIRLQKRISGFIVAPNKKDILILDHSNQAMVVLHKNGKPSFRINLENYDTGSGPTVNGICVVDSQIFVIDNPQKKILVFDQHYSLVSTISTGDYKPELICSFGKRYTSHYEGIVYPSI